MKLTNTVTNITKNNKGFSLLEVLVGVSIIGIISAIAVPTFTKYRESASLTAGNTTADNIVKAYRNCLVLNNHAQCNTLARINMTCPDCKELSTPHASNFCAYYDKPIGGQDFKLCVSVAAGQATKTIGGAFKVCTRSCTANSACCGGGTCSATTDEVVPGKALQLCDAKADCGNTDGNPVGSTYACKTRTSGGTCASGGTCN